MAVLNHLRQIGVGRTHQTHVDLQRLTAAHALQFAIFNHPQQLFLTSIGAVASSSRNRVPPSARSKRPDDAGAGKGAGFMAKQFAIQQIFIQRRAVEGDERSLPARREKCRRLAISSLPGTAFTNNQHRFVQRRQPRHLFQHLEKAVRFAEQVVLVFRHDEIRHLIV
jgi:hypothetical protein